MSEGEILADQKVPPDSGGAARRITNHITPPETARPCLTLYSPAYSSSENALPCLGPDTAHLETRYILNTDVHSHTSYIPPHTVFRILLKI